MKEKFKHLKPIQNIMVLALLMLLFILATQTSAIGQTLCDGRVPTIIGTEANDKLIGTDGPDVIHGLGGFDIIWGMGGDDVICGGDGTDNLSGRDGNDIIFGENGYDSIWGGSGNDVLSGGDGNDAISGGPGNDELRGDNGNDSLYGRSGVDELYGGEGIENNDSCYDEAGTFIKGCEQFNGAYMPPAPVPKTGQTHSEAPGDDGDLQKGVPWPDPRFTDNGDGTVTDNLTGLIWLKNADCFGKLEWEEALTASAQMANGDCELSDGSRPGDWRLSNVKELYSLIAFANPGLGNALPAGHPFDVPEFRGWEDIYWTSTYLYRFGNEYPVAYAYTIDVMHGRVLYGTIWECDPTGCSNETRGYIWPVRGGN